MRKIIRTVVGLSIAASALLGGAAPALAHAGVTTASPAAHSQLSGNPPYVDLHFNSPVIGAEQVQLHDGAGRLLRTGRVEVLEGGRRMRARIPTLGSGDYVVDWRALSRDGHLSLGRYGFSVGVAGQLVGSSQGPVPVLESSVRWIYLMALLIAFGSLFTRVFTWSRLRLLDGRHLPALPIVTLLEVAGAGAITQAGLVIRRGGLDLTQAPVRVALLQAVLVLVALALAMRGGHPRRLLGTLGLTVVVAALGGHSVSSGHWWAGPANAVHLLAVALWTGGLAQLLLVGWSLRARVDQPALLAAARQYARFALLSVVLAIFTGVLSAAAEFGSLQQLTASGYGRVLLVKVGLVGITLVLALAARTIALPSRRPSRPRLLRRLVRGESAVLAGVIAAAALLANSAPPATAAAAPEQVPMPVLKAPVLEQVDFDGRFLVRLRVDADTVLVQLQDSTGRAPRGAHIDVFTVTPDYDDLNVFPRPCGDGCAAGDYPLQAGSTALLVVSRYGGRESTVAFAVKWPPVAGDTAALASLRDALGRRSSLTVREQVTGVHGTVQHPGFQVGGADAAHALGLDAPGLTVLPFQPPSGALLLVVPGGAYYEVQFAEDGALSHELITTASGRTERFVE
ncbi:MAG: copper resistance protein CopC [Candidatus Dormibacteraeota bacterium]|nr:copper resistance protein CopC [Candidatus Dormibacteraeota bacterium]